MKNGRSRFDTMVDIIDAAKNGATYEELISKAGLGIPHALFKEYVDFTLQQKLLKATAGTNNNDIYSPTEKGLGFSTKYQEKIKPLLTQK